MIKRPTHNTPNDFIKKLMKNEIANFENDKLKVLVEKDRDSKRIFTAFFYFKSGESWVRFSTCVSDCVTDIVNDFKEELKIYNA